MMSSMPVDRKEWPKAKRDICKNCGVCRYQGNGVWEPNIGCFDRSQPKHEWVPNNTLYTRTKEVA